MSDESVSADERETSRPPPRGGGSFGDVLEVIQVGAVTVTRRYGCTRRDQYELRAQSPFPPELREQLDVRKASRGGPDLYVIDEPGAFQLTVAPKSARALMMPRLATQLEAQRGTALSLAGIVDALLRQALT